MTHHIELPRYIALCGNPKAGKSTVQEILERCYGVRPVDDGLPIRTIAVEQMGLTWRQVRTQEGKLETVNIAGKRWVVRDLLGQIGNRLEDLLGPHGIPYLVERTVADKPGHFSFGSVRRDQGLYYQVRDGVVIEIRNPNAPPSPYEFDRYDARLADAVIHNDGHDLRALEKQVHETLSYLAKLKPLRDQVVAGIVSGEIRCESFGEGEGTIPASKLHLAPEPYIFGETPDDAVPAPELVIWGEAA